MSAPYVLDEMPLMGDLPYPQQSVYLDIPSLEKSLYNRDYGPTIYGSGSEWGVCVAAYAGKSAFHHWMSSPVWMTTRFFALIFLRVIWTRRVITQDWVGKAVLVSGHPHSEIHFLVYSESLDVSLDLHLELSDSIRATYDMGLRFLSEIRPH